MVENPGQNNTNSWQAEIKKQMEAVEWAKNFLKSPEGKKITQEIKAAEAKQDMLTLDVVLNPSRWTYIGNGFSTTPLSGDEVLKVTNLLVDMLKSGDISVNQSGEKSVTEKLHKLMPCDNGVTVLKLTFTQRDALQRRRTALAAEYGGKLSK